MNNGWIKIHRKILEWEWWDDPKTLKMFIFLLLKANHEEKKWHGNTIKRGQLITGRKTLAKECGLSEQSVRTSIKRLKSTNQITIKTTNRFSLITLNNYESYQQTNQPANQQSTNNQPQTRIKELKNNIYGKEFNKLNYTQKGLVFQMIKKFKDNTGEEPKQENIDIMIAKVTNN